MDKEPLLASIATDSTALLSESHQLLSTIQKQDSSDSNAVDFDAIFDEQQATQPPPPDTYQVSYIIFFLLGIGMLFPWNVFINANEYFHARFQGSPFTDSYPNFFSISYMISNVFWLAIALRTQSTAKPMKRIVVALCLNAFIFLFCMVLTRLSGVEPYMDFYLNVVMVVVCGASTAYLQNGVFGLASLFPPIYIQAVMSGQGLAGSAVSISQIVTLMAKNNDSETDKVTLEVYYNTMYLQ